MISQNIPIVSIVPGYCIPNTEQQKLEVKLYIKQVKEILSTSSCKIIFTGGSTAIVPPYAQTEANILLEEWNVLGAKQEQQIIIEDQAISTLENILFSKNILRNLNIHEGVIWIFVEDIRLKRMEKIVNLVLGGYTVEIFSLHLGHQSDSSAKEGERIATEWIKWALEKPDNMKWYHQVFAEKIIAARSSYEERKKFNAVTWWQTKWEEIKERLRSSGYSI